MMSENMRIYDQGREVPQEAQKAFNNGRFSGTDINPMWRIKMLTELFGPAGIGWYYEIISERSEQLQDDTIIAVVDLNLYIKVDGEWSKPIYGTGGNTLVSKTKSGAVSVSDEGYKMALTDALSVACKALGIGADVYFDKDKTKYTNAQNQPQKGVQKPAAKPAPKPAEAPAHDLADADLISQIYELAQPEDIAWFEQRYGNCMQFMPKTTAMKAIAKLKGEA